MGRIWAGIGLILVGLFMLVGFLRADLAVSAMTTAIAVLVAVVVFVWAIMAIRADRPVTYAEITEHFKYGSIGSEPGGSPLRTIGGVLPPYWIFKALPSICSEKLPGGYASLGFVMEPGKDLPVGISRRRRLGIDQVAGARFRGAI